MLIKIFDITSAVMTVVFLNLVSKTYKAWIGYTVGSIFFTIVCFNKNLPGLGIMGIILFLTGIKNFWMGLKNDKTKK